MKNENSEELRVLAQRLLAKGTDFSTSYGPDVERYKALAEENQHSPALNDALVEQVGILMKEGRYFEALQVHEKRLQENPLDLAAQQNWRGILNEVHGILARLAHSAPQCAEYGRTYEMLLEAGCVGTVVHLGAVRHYLASGQIEKAVERLLKLLRVAPNTSGIKDALSRLSQVSDDVRIHQLSLSNLESERKNT